VRSKRSGKDSVGIASRLGNAGDQLSENPPWLNKLNKYFADAILLHESDLWAAKHGRTFIKWWLEVVRNLLVVSAFYFLAQKSDSIVLKVLANVTFLVFFGYFATWQNTFSVRFFPYIKNPKVNFWFNFVVWVAVCMPIYVFILFALAQAFQALSQVSPK
jgi:hypothetical protein